jgi:hypothetical protein
LPTSFNTSAAAPEDVVGNRQACPKVGHAALAARGDSNRQIARTVFITVSTVEQYLTRVYRKIDVDRRTDLPAEFRLSFGAKRCPHQCLTQPWPLPVVAS